MFQLHILVRRNNTNKEISKLELKLELCIIDKWKTKLVLFKNNTFLFILFWQIKFKYGLRFNSLKQLHYNIIDALHMNKN